MRKRLVAGQQRQATEWSTSLILVRHADVYNPQRVVYGRLPRFRLSEVGLAQAERTAQYLAATEIAAVYSSPMLRARQTASIIARYHSGLPVHLSKLIAEVGTSWQGTPSRELHPDFDFYESAAERGDETVEDIAGRMRRFVERVRSDCAGRAVVAVSHADPMAILRASLLGEPLAVDDFRRTYYPAKGAVLRLDFSGESAIPAVSYVDPSVDVEAVNRAE